MQCSWPLQLEEYELGNTENDKGLQVLTLALSTAEGSVHAFPSLVVLEYSFAVLAFNGCVLLIASVRVGALSKEEYQVPEWVPLLIYKKP